MIRAIAIDDEPLALNIILHYCTSIDYISLEKTFTKQSDALKYINKFPVDLLFLDINMPKTNGIDFYKGLENVPMVIFTTAYSEFAIEGFNVNAMDYLLKPISQERFIQAVQKAKSNLDLRTSNEDQSHIMIRADYKLHRIPLDDILFIEGLDDYIKIHLTNASKIVARFSMKGILDDLPDKKFIRIHRSFIVSVNKIQSVKNKTIHIEDYVIPIGDTYKNEILKL